MRAAAFLASLITLLNLCCSGSEIQQRRVQVDPDTGTIQPHPPIDVEPSDSAQVSLSASEKRFAELVNEHRKKVGCPPLQINEKLQKLATNHSRDMAARDFFSHTNPDGQSPFDRMKSAGIRYSWAAENIAYGQRTATEVLNSWLNSSGHRQNIENCKLREHGIGHYSATNHWTHVFATIRQ
ncbi:MAG: hypothetical protein CMN77_05275 [Spirochaetaceae bacterium]|nr:hypothetical protein [Spirochaetaceae bacterium]|tara:strand:- start:9450 stop:9995 length:546 start_codon:yes stop_codon:yes gene_type:complete